MESTCADLFSHNLVPLVEGGKGGDECKPATDSQICTEDFCAPCGKIGH